MKKLIHLFSKFLGLVLTVNLLPALVLAAHGPTPSAIPVISCHVATASGVTAVTQTSQDSDHIYFSGHDDTATYDAVYHIQENFVYLHITTGPSDNPIKVSGNFLLNGVGLSATLSFNQGSQLEQFSCQE